MVRNPFDSARKGEGERVEMIDRTIPGMHKAKRNLLSNILSVSIVLLIDATTLQYCKRETSQYTIQFRLSNH
jgi:hypothetical protein